MKLGGDDRPLRLPFADHDARAHHSRVERSVLDGGRPGAVREEVEDAVLDAGRPERGARSERRVYGGGEHRGVRTVARGRSGVAEDRLVVPAGGGGR